MLQGEWEGVLPPGKATSLEEGSEATVILSWWPARPNLPAWVSGLPPAAEVADGPEPAALLREAGSQNCIASHCSLPFLEPHCLLTVVSIWLI